MGVIFKIDKRRIIPRLRSFEISSKNGELELNQKATSSGRQFNSKEYLDEQLYSWENNKSLPYAGDLLSSAFVLGLESEFLDVAKFIISNDEDENSPILSIARKTLKISSESIFENKTSDIITFDPSQYFSEIRKLKFSLTKEPRNPIAWVELGRLYSLLGQIKKAKKCVDHSLSLDRNNRFIVRSASRFYHHFFKDNELALRIVRGSEFLNYDPWLISAEIAYSSILERFSKLIKVGKQILESNRFDNGSITELASAVATVEFLNGKNKEAKKFFNQSLIKPNDNSLAQAEWISDNVKGLRIEESKFNVPFAFEANTISSYEKEKYIDAYESAIEWKNDEPYSTRPILSASYVAGIFLDKENECIQLLKEGYRMNNDDLRIGNNLVYFLAIQGKIEEASAIFRANLGKFVEDTSIDVDKITIIATAGLIRYREGFFDEGKKLYLRAIQLAEKDKNEYVVALALGNLLREEILANRSMESLAGYLGRFKKLNEQQENPDVKLLFKQVMTSYNKLKNSTV